MRSLKTRKIYRTVWCKTSRPTCWRHGGRYMYAIADQIPRGFAHCRRPPNRDGPTERSPTEEVTELRNSSFSNFRQHRRKTYFLRGFLKNPLVEGVLGEHTQLSPKDFLSSFTRVCFLPKIIYIYIYFLLILCGECVEGE